MNASPPPDRRRNAWREDRAALKLRGVVDSPCYVAPEAGQVIAASAPLLRRPEAGLGYETELVHGELIDIYEAREGWLWVQAQRDGYVGYLLSEAAGPVGPAATHRVIAHRSFLYPGPTIKATPRLALPFMAQVAVLARQGEWCETPQGFVYAPHLGVIDAHSRDPVAVAQRFLGVPYLWGGKTSLGYDCSGLVQTCCFACGIAAPRDSDMQEAELGTPLPLPDDLSTIPRGALLFWPGHVALSEGSGRMIHANAFHMMVQSEEIVPAVARIAAKGDPLRSLRMLPPA
jgi:hypothetical protein